MLQLGASYLSLQAPVTPLHYSRKIWCAHGAQGQDGQLGHGDAEDHHLPRIVSAHNTMNFIHYICDSHCLAITGDGDVFSWGRNQNGKLGLGHTDACNMPQKVLAFQGIVVTMLPVGAEHTVAVTKVEAWLLTLPLGSLPYKPYLAYTING
ncbi:unnamed protein product [Sphagnum balticum]